MLWKPTVVEPTIKLHISTAITLLIIALLILFIEGCVKPDPNAPLPPPPPIGHVEITKVDGKISKIEVNLYRSQYRLDNQQEAKKLLVGLQAIVADLESAVEEMKVKEPNVPLN